MLHSLLFNMLPVITAYIFPILPHIGPVCGEVQVIQWPQEVHLYVGNTVTFYCAVKSDGEKVDQCSPYWRVMNQVDSKPTLEVNRAPQYRGHYYKQEEDWGNYTFLSIRNLQVNHSNIFYCLMMCMIDQQHEIMKGNGSVLNVTHPPVREDHGGYDPSVLWWVYALFAVNGLVLSGVIALCLAILWRRPWCPRQQRPLYAKPLKTRDK